MKKLKLISLLVPLMALTSCGKDPYAGTYSFQMGKEKSTHFSFVMDLTNEEFSIPGQSESKGKRFTLSVDIDTGAKDGGKDDDTASSILDIFSGKKIPGYYSVGGPTEKDRNRLNLGLSIEEVASLFLDEVKDFIPFEDITQIISIDYAMTEKIIFSEIDKKSLYLTVPVSLDDFMFQLYWYGYDFQFDVLNDRYEMVKDPEGGHEVGTHPTQEEVDEINKTYPDNHVESESSKINYRDFHALTLGLKKN